MIQLDQSHVFISAEHASADLPQDAPDLGLNDQTLKSHASWDPGAAELARAIAQAIGAPLLLGDHSRLLADLNRSPDNPQVVPEVAFGVLVPGNRELKDRDREERIRKYHKPYWDEANRQVTSMISNSGHCLHISVHSFTPEIDPPSRRFDLGLLYDPAHELECQIAKKLAAQAMMDGYSVEHNRPYSGTADGLTTALRNRLPQLRYTSVEIEINQGSMRGEWAKKMAQTIIAGLS